MKEKHQDDSRMNYSPELTPYAVLFLSSQPPVNHSHSHVLPARDRLQERVRLHPVETSAKLRGENHIQKKTPGTDHVQIREQQLSWSGDSGS